MPTPNPCSNCQTSLAACSLAEEARCRIAHGEDGTRVVHVVLIQGKTGYLSESLPAPAPNAEYQSLQHFAGTTH